MGCSTNRLEVSGKYVLQSKSYSYGELTLNQDSSFQYLIRATFIGTAAFTGKWKVHGNRLRLIPDLLPPPKKEVVFINTIKSDSNRVVIIDLLDSALLAGVELEIDDKKYITDLDGTIILPYPLNGRFRLKYVGIDKILHHQCETTSQVIIHIQFKDPDLLMSSIPVTKYRIQGDRLLIKKKSNTFYQKVE